MKKHKPQIHFKKTEQGAYAFFLNGRIQLTQEQARAAWDDVGSHYWDIPAFREMSDTVAEENRKAL